MSDMWDTSAKVISPDTFLHAVWKVMPSFHGYQQQDTQEFLRYLIDAMHSELSAVKGRTIIMDIFQGSLSNKVHMNHKDDVFEVRGDF